LAVQVTTVLACKGRRAWAKNFDVNDPGQQKNERLWCEFFRESSMKKKTFDVFSQNFPPNKRWFLTTAKDNKKEGNSRDSILAE